MDHKWGRNVGLYGVAGPNTTLAARTLESPNVIVTNGGYYTDDYFVVWFILGPNQPYGYRTFLKSLFAPLHFPYGIPVEPDAPV